MYPSNAQGPSTDEIFAQRMAQVRSSVAFLSNLGLTLFLVAGYLALAANSLTHPDLAVQNGTIEAPLFGVSVSMPRFFFWVPLILVGLHGYFLFERLRFATLLRAEATAASDAGINGRLPVFVPVLLLADQDFWDRFGRKAGWVPIVIYIILTFIPALTLLFVQISYLPASNRLATLGHRAFFLLDVVLICGSYWLALSIKGFVTWRSRLRRVSPVIIVGILLSVALLSNDDSSGDTRTTRFPLDLEGWSPKRPTIPGQHFRLATKSLPGANLRYADLSGYDLSNSNFRFADFTGASLRSAKLIGADLYGAILIEADLTGADFSNANLANTQLDRSDFSGATLHGASLVRARGQDVVMFASDLRFAHFTAADLYRVDLRVSDLRGAWLRAARFLDGNLDGCEMSSPVELATGLDLRGASVRAVTGLPQSGIDLGSAVFQEVDWGAVDQSSPVLGDGDIDELGQMRLDLGDQITELRELKWADHDKFWVEDQALRGAEMRLESLQARDGRSPSLSIQRIEPVDQAFHRRVARSLVPSACRDEALASFVFEKAQGRYRPVDLPSERALVKEMLYWVRAENDCPLLSPRREELLEIVCARFRDDPDWRTGCGA